MLWNSKLVILDEPTAALGVAQTEQVLNLVRRLADNGLGVILISHNMNDVMQVADNIACLYLGALAAQVQAKRREPRPRSSSSSRPVAAASWGCNLRSSTCGRCGMSTVQQTTDVDIAAAGAQGGIEQAISDYFNRVKGGDVGSLPAVLGADRAGRSLQHPQAVDLLLVRSTSPTS